ncbi:hypothetical protein [Streptobacillus canis]|uniref:hypothetical protein n=1 Tax=Streptobacillus canis TaxID=2678686 RepID=UPI0012E29A7C|nr:hypothetical protein [Streptobacillus canis]
MNKKMLLTLLGVSSLALAASPFNFENAKPLSIEVDTKGTVSNTIVGKNFDAKDTTFKHNNKVVLDVYEFAKVTGELAYKAGKAGAALEPSETGAKVELNFKKYGNPYVSMYADKTLTLGYKNEGKVNKVKVNGDAEYKLSNEFKTHTLKVGAGSEYTINPKTNAKARVELKYNVTPSTKKHIVTPKVSGEVTYKHSDMLSVTGSTEVSIPITVLNKDVTPGLDTKTIVSTEIKPIKNLTVNGKVELGTATTFVKAGSSLNINTTVTGSLESGVAYDITKEIHTVDRLVITPSFDAKLAFGGLGLSLTPAVEAKYEIIKNLKVNAKAETGINFGKTVSNKYGYLNSTPSLKVGLNYKW